MAAYINSKEQVPICSAQFAKFLMFLACETKSSRTWSPNRAFDVHLTDRSSRCATSKRPVSIEKEAKGWLLRTALIFSGTFNPSSTIGCVVQPDDALRWQFWSRSTGPMYFSSKLSVSDFRPSATALSWLMRFCKSSLVGMGFWPMTGSAMNESTLKAISLFEDQTRSCCRLFSRPLYCDDWSPSVYSLRCKILKNIWCTVALVISFAKGALWSNPREGEFWDVSCIL